MQWINVNGSQGAPFPLSREKRDLSNLLTIIHLLSNNTKTRSPAQFWLHCFIFHSQLSKYKQMQGAVYLPFWLLGN